MWQKKGKESHFRGNICLNFKPWSVSKSILSLNPQGGNPQYDVDISLASWWWDEVLECKEHRRQSEIPKKLLPHRNLDLDLGVGRGSS